MSSRYFIDSSGCLYKQDKDMFYMLDYPFWIEIKKPSVAYLIPLEDIMIGKSYKGELILSKDFISDATKKLRR